MTDRPSCTRPARSHRAPRWARAALHAELALGFAALALVGCGPAAPEPAPAARASVGALAGASAGWPRDVALPGGGTLRLAAAPRRIVPVNAGAVDLLHELVGPERIAALPDQVLEWSRVPGGAPGWSSLPRFARFTAEPVLAFQPDLVVGDPLGAAETVAQLRAGGVALLFAGETRTLEDAVAFARTLGAALGCEAAAADLAARTLARRDALCARPGPRVGKRAVSYSNMGAGGWAAGGVTTAAETLRLARLENAAAAKRGHARLTHEELIALDPDLIVVSAAWEGEGGFDCREWLLAEPALADLAAVRGARVLAMPPRLFAATSQEIASAAEWLAEEADRLFADAEPLPGAAHE